METTLEDRFAVYLRVRSDVGDSPEGGEQMLDACTTYEDACKVRHEHRSNGRECIIRYLGEAGGGD